MMNRPLFTILATLSLLLAIVLAWADFCSYAIGDRWVDIATNGYKTTTASEAGKLIYWTIHIGPVSHATQWHQRTPGPLPTQTQAFRDAGADVWEIQYAVLIGATLMLPALWLVSLDWPVIRRRFGKPQTT